MGTAALGLILMVLGGVVLARARRMDAANAEARDLQKGTWVEWWYKLFPFTDVAGTRRGVSAIRFGGGAFLFMGVILLLVGLAS